MPDLMSDRIRLQFMIETERKRDRPSLAMIERWEIQIRIMDHKFRKNEKH